MNKSKRTVPVVSTVSALALVAFAGAAYAQSATDKAYDAKADAQKMESKMDQHHSMAAKGKDDAKKIAQSFGVSELNDIEDWEIKNGSEELGSIDRLGVDRNTGELLAVVGLEGVVGVNMKEVAVPLSKLTKAGDETLSTDLTKDELQAKRDIDPWDGTFTQIVQ
jgi:Ni/Co efflux regulator RcnB